MKGMVCFIESHKYNVPTDVYDVSVNDNPCYLEEILDLTKVPWCVYCIFIGCAARQWHATSDHIYF